MEFLSNIGGMGGMGGGSPSGGKTTSATLTQEVGHGGSVGIVGTDLIWIAGILSVTFAVGLLVYALVKK